MVTRASAHDESLAARFLDAVSAPLPTTGADAGSEASVGIDARYHETSEFIRRERAKLHGLSGARVEWSEVCERGVALLAQESKDLSVAVAVATGLAKANAFPGVAQGLEGIALLLERFGERLFPQRPSARDQALAWYFEQLSAQITEATVSIDDGLSLDAATTALGRITQRLPADASETFAPLAATRRALERLGLTHAELAATLEAKAPAAANTPASSPDTGAETPVAAASSTAGDMPDAATTQSTGAAATAVAAPQQPPVAREGEAAQVLNAVTGEAGAEALSNLSEGQLHDTASAPPSPSSPSPAESAALAAALKREGRDLVDRGRTLLAADPLSEVGWHLWFAGLYLPLVTLPESRQVEEGGAPRTQVPPPQPHLLRPLAQDWPKRGTSAHLSELRALLEASRLCFDAFAALHDTLDAWGGSASSVAHSVAAQAQLIDARLPGLRSLRFADGSPCASLPTQAWLDARAASRTISSAAKARDASSSRADGDPASSAPVGVAGKAAHETAAMNHLVASDAGAPSATTPAGARATSAPSLTLTPGAGCAEALTALADQVARAGAGVDAFLARLDFAELLLAQAHAAAAAKPILNALLAEAQARALSTWQPQLVARLLLAYSRLP